MWLQSGDQNTRYFYAWVNIRRKDNKLSRLKSGDGRWRDWDTWLPDLMIEYFNDLFAATDTHREQVTNCLANIVT